MARQWTSTDTFHLGINMAGAVSAGAYTAGVLDFLIEALEEWYKAKAAPGPAVPMHNVSIDVFSGASAGGMCAAIASAMVQGPFEHIRNPQDAQIKDTTNKFYESWVNRIDIEWLLQTTDLGPGAKILSLLDSEIIDEIADYALAPTPVGANPAYISDSLTLFVTLTNVRGVPFSLSADADGSAEESIAYYADRLQFETVRKPTDSPQFTGARTLPLEFDPQQTPSPGSWSLLGDAAKATGAFPLFLKPREIDRLAGEYMNSPWQPLADPTLEGVKPLWTLDTAEAPFKTLNVDGGVTNNDPFELAHDYLAIHNPLAVRDCNTGQLLNPRTPQEANCAVLSVAPFPSKEVFDPQFSFEKASSILGMLPSLFTALISQSRFLGESLSADMGKSSCSRFVMAPADARHPGGNALQCGLLSAFGGFFERGFRAHDYQLGRRNCQKFLRDNFRLALDNPVIAAGLAKLDNPNAVIGDYGAVAEAGVRTLPIIPLCGTAVPEVAAPVRATIRSARVDQIADWVIVRLHAIAAGVIDSAIKPGPEHAAAKLAAETLIANLGRVKIRELLHKELLAVISG